MFFKLTASTSMYDLSSAGFHFVNIQLNCDDRVVWSLLISHSLQRLSIQVLVSKFLRQSNYNSWALNSKFIEENIITTHI